MNPGAVAPALIALALIVFAPPARGELIEVMSFNIRYGTAADGDNAWSLRREMVTSLIAREGPTVLGIQEALEFQLDEMLLDLPGYLAVGVGRDDGDRAGEFSAILYDSHRLDGEESGTFWFSDHPEEPGSIAEDWGNRIPRICTWARFRAKGEKRSFTVWNLHWDHEAQKSRVRSAGLLLAMIREFGAAGEPYLVMGDFNAGESNPAVRLLLESGLRDSFRVLHPKAEGVGTFGAFSGRRDGEKIDAILISPAWAVRGAAILHDNRKGRYPSDHYPVTATLVLTTDAGEPSPKRKPK